MTDRPQVGQRTGPVVVALPAEIDLTNAEQVGAELDAACASGAGVVIADLTATSFCDSAGIRYLLLANDAATAHEAQLRLAVQPEGMVLRTLTLMGLHRILRVHFSLDDAMAA
jgi:anti-sigma B factor antagonist